MKQADIITLRFNVEESEIIARALRRELREWKGVHTGDGIWHRENIKMLLTSIKVQKEWISENA